MTVNPYTVLGPSIPDLLGRAALLRQIDRHLRKATPDHVSVVGPALYGKSVVLRHVADAYRARSKSVGDFGQHLNSFPESKVTLGFATSVVLAAISLVESLTADLHGEEKPSSRFDLTGTNGVKEHGASDG